MNIRICHAYETQAAYPYEKIWNEQNPIHEEIPDLGNSYCVAKIIKQGKCQI